MENIWEARRLDAQKKEVSMMCLTKSHIICMSPTVICLNFSTGEAKICSRSSNQNRIQNTGGSTELVSNFIRLANMKEETIYSVETEDIKDKKQAKRTVVQEAL